MTTKESKITAVSVNYEKVQRALNRLGVIYNIPRPSHAMQDVQNAIGDYADAEIELHTHEAEKIDLVPIKDEQMEAAHVELEVPTYFYQP